MATKKFKKNLITLLNLFESSEEFLDFLIDKKSFNEDFVKNITNSNYLKELKKLNGLDINEIKKKLQYEVAYNQKKNKISVDITKNDIFSYLDTEDELINKMNVYILNEDYERAQIMKIYFKTIELDYM